MAELEGKLGYEPGKEMPLYSGKYNQEVFTRVRDKLVATEAEPPFNDNSVSILKMRYLRKDENRNPLETTKDLVARVAAYIAYPDFVYSGGDEDLYTSSARNFYKMIANREFMPNSPTLMNAGREGGMGMLSACFVLPVEDSISAIFEGVTTTAMIQKAGGGTGFTFDHLRPTGDYISSSGGTTSGPISFWRVYAVATDSIQQGAFRRGANMGMFSVEHPDILKFINAKKYMDEFRNYNISVKVTDKWMNTLIASPDAPLVVTNPRGGKKYYVPADIDIMGYTLSDLIPVDKAEDKDLKKVYTFGMLWQNIIENAHARGDPGIAFIDRLNEDNPTPALGRIEATNPCGEQPLLPYEACNLGSINLGLMIKDGVPDYERIREFTRKGVRFLDNVIEMNLFPDERITEIVKGNRKIGFGVMGWADMLAALKIRYDTPEAIELAEKVMGVIHEEATKETEKLAEERGAFPNFDRSVYAGGKKRRNATTTTVAPTGTIALIAGASQGIEPFFGNAYSHRDAEGNIRQIKGPELKRALEARGVDSEMVFKQLFEGKKLSEIPEVPEDIAQVYVTSHEIPIEKQIQMQAAFQRHVDNAVSKTINLVEEATVEDVDRAYRAAYMAKLKGITVYRNGSDEEQPIIFGKKLEEGPLVRRLVGTIDHPLKVPEMMPAIRIRQETPWGQLHMMLVFDPSNDYRPLEMFSLLGQSGEEEAATLEALGRLGSLHMRSGGDLEVLVDQLIGIGSGITRSTRSGHVSSLAMGLAKAALKFLVARKYFPLEDMLMGRVDYDQFSEQVSDMIRQGEDGEGGIRVLLKNYKRGQDFLEKEEGPPKSEVKKSALKIRAKNHKRREKCPECGGALIRVEGCLKCSSNCGFSRC